MGFQTAVVSFASYLAWFWLLRRYPATQVTAFTLLTPLAGLSSTFMITGFGVLWAVVFLGERIGWRTWAGIGLAFGGVLVLGFDPLVLDAPAALLMTLTAALMLAAGTTMMRGVRGVDVFQMQAWTALLGIPVDTVIAGSGGRFRN